MQVSPSRRSCGICIYVTVQDYDEERRNTYDDPEGDQEDGCDLQMQKLLLIRLFAVRIKM